jgi:hypothetical protein
MRAVFELAQIRKEILLKQGREKQKETLGGYKYSPSVLSIVDKTDHNTRHEIAEELGWSTGKVACSKIVVYLILTKSRELMSTIILVINRGLQFFEGVSLRGFTLSVCGGPVFLKSRENENIKSLCLAPPGALSCHT